MNTAGRSAFVVGLRPICFPLAFTFAIPLSDFSMNYHHNDKSLGRCERDDAGSGCGSDYRAVQRAPNHIKLLLHKFINSSTVIHPARELACFSISFNGNVISKWFKAICDNSCRSAKDSSSTVFRSSMVIRYPCFCFFVIPNTKPCASSGKFVWMTLIPLVFLCSFHTAIVPQPYRNNHGQRSNDT